MGVQSYLIAGRPLHPEAGIAYLMESSASAPAATSVACGDLRDALRPAVEALAVQDADLRLRRLQSSGADDQKMALAHSGNGGWK